MFIQDLDRFSFFLKQPINKRQDFPGYQIHKPDIPFGHEKINGNNVNNEEAIYKRVVKKRNEYLGQFQVITDVNIKKLVIDILLHKTDEHDVYIEERGEF